MNCQTKLDPEKDNYCPNCGQKNLRKKLLLRDLLHEFFSSLIAYDSRLQKSLKKIVRQPGQIAIDYIHGKRARYVNPFRMFISIALIFFILSSWMSNAKYIEFNGLEVEHVEPLDSLKSTDGTFHSEHINQYIVQTDSITYEKAQKELGFEDNLINYFRFKFKFGVKKVIENEEAFYSYIISKLPFLLFFFLPVFTLFSRLFYLRKPISYTEHLIFNFYQQSIFFLFLTLGLLVAQIYTFNFFILFGALFGIYNTIAFKSFYQQGYGVTILKVIGLSAFYTVVCMLAIVVFLVIGVVFF